MDNKILERRVFLDEEQGTVTVYVKLEPQTPRERTVKYTANHARRWLLENKKIAAGEKISGDMLRNNITSSRFGQTQYVNCEGRFVFRLVKDEPEPEVVKPEPKPVVKKAPAKKPAAKKTTTTRRRRTTKKSKGE